MTGRHGCRSKIFLKKTVSYVMLARDTAIVITACS